jgi:uncharacterized protein (TIGR03437 family)
MRRPSFLRSCALLLILLGWIGGTLCAQGIIATVAGRAKFFPSSGLTAATAISPWGIGVSASGDLYFSDRPSNSVLRLSAAGNLTVVAGNGIEGYSGDGGPAVMASLAEPLGISLDTAGNLYIADSDNHRIRRVDPNGTITTVAGNGHGGFGGDGGPAVSAMLAFPNDVTMDSHGNLFIVDTGNVRVRVVTPDGLIKTIAGTGVQKSTGDGGPAVNASFIFPENITFDAQGNIYVSDTADSTIRRISTAGTITTFAGTHQFGYSGDGGPAASATLAQPQGLRFDAAGNLYVAEYASNHIRRINSNGVIDTVAGDGQARFSGDGGPAKAAELAFPASIALDSSGQIYISDSDNQRIRKISTGGVITTVAGTGAADTLQDGGPGTSASLASPTALAMDKAGNLYICDVENQRIRQLRTGGTIVTFAGNGSIAFSGDGGPATSASFAYPSAVALDVAGNLYVADRNNHRIRRITPGGIVTTFAGNGQGGFSGEGKAATSAMLAYPSAVAVDPAGNVYIADTGNAIIRMVSTSGIITTIAGNMTVGYSGDGSLATKAMLSANVSGLALDSDGSLYIADSSNNVIRMVDRSGIIRTVAGNPTSTNYGDGGPAVNAALRSPTAVVLDAAGNLYIADTQSDRIRLVDGTGRISTVAGTGEGGFSGDGNLATLAKIEYPTGLALDSTGTLYIGDRLNNRIRAVLSAPPTFTASPATLSFSVSAGGAPSASQTISVTPAVSNPILNAAGLPFAVTASDPWLLVNVASGTLPANLNVSVDPSSLTAGSYNGTVTISAPYAASPLKKISVAVSVAGGAAAKVSVSAPSLTFAVIQGAADSGKTLSIANAGSGTLSYSVSAVTTTGGNWLSVSQTSGTATPSQPGMISVTASSSSLAPGTYQGNITVTGATPADVTVVPVVLSISPAQGTILLSQTGLTFQVVAGGGNPLSQTFGILNIGQGVLNWTLQPSTLSGGNWLTVTNTSGTVNTPYVDVSSVSVGVSAASLSPGNYYGQIVVSAAGAVNSPQSITVLLIVLPAGANPGPQVIPTGLIFTGTAGVSPGSQQVKIANVTSVSFNYASGKFTTDGAPWILQTPANATVNPNQPATMVVGADFTSLGSGVYRGAITVQIQEDGSIRTINVLTVVAPSTVANTASSFQSAALGCSSAQLQVQFRSLQANFIAAVGQSTTIEVQVVDACGNLIGPNNTPSSVTAAFTNGDSQVNLTHIGNGVWTGTWRPVHPSTASVTLDVVATAIEGTSPKAGHSTLPATLTAGGTAPLVVAGGVVHAASFSAGTPLAPGSLITIYGSNLADGTSAATGLPLPQQSNGVQVMMGDLVMPQLYTSAGQLNVQVPFNVPQNTQYQITIQRDSLLSVPEPLVIASGQPGVFTLDQSGSGQGIIVKIDGVTLAQPGTPAVAGDNVVIYCTGLGAVFPAVSTGAAAPSSPLANTVNPVTVQIGGLAAAVSFSGLTPGSAGLYQVNATVPTGIAPSDTVPVVLSVAGQSSPPVTMAVR